MYISQVVVKYFVHKMRFVLNQLKRAVYINLSNFGGNLAPTLQHKSISGFILIKRFV